MQIGDLVRVLAHNKVSDLKEDLPLGIVVGFDEDDDPIVFEARGRERGEKLAHYRKHLEVINDNN